eukprot:1138618-Pelagomonas_calceolata.AAC.1
MKKTPNLMASARAMHNNPSGGAHFNAGPSSQEGESLANELGNAQQYLSELEALSHRIVSKLELSFICQQPRNTFACIIDVCMHN